MKTQRKSNLSKSEMKELVQSMWCIPFDSNDPNSFLNLTEYAKTNGKGKLVKVDGSKYEGEFKNRIPHGVGTMIFPNGTMYKGEFKNGEENGNGTLILPDGTKFEGEFKNGHPNGKGKVIKLNGEECEGEYRNGIICSGTLILF